MEALGSRNINVITVFVEDLIASKSFYQEVFGLSAFMKTTTPQYLTSLT